MIFASQNIQLDVEMIAEPALSWPQDNPIFCLCWGHRQKHYGWTGAEGFLKLRSWMFFLVDFSNCNVESCCMLHLSGHQARCSFWRRCHCSGGVCQSIGRGWKMVEMVVMVMRFASRRCQICTWIVGNDAFFFVCTPEARKKKAGLSWVMRMVIRSSSNVTWIAVGRFSRAGSSTEPVANLAGSWCLLCSSRQRCPETWVIWGSVSGDRTMGRCGGFLPTLSRPALVGRPWVKLQWPKVWRKRK